MIADRHANTRGQSIIICWHLDLKCKLHVVSGTALEGLGGL